MDNNMRNIDMDLIKMFDSLDSETQQKIISFAAASIQEQSNSQLFSDVPPKAAPTLT